jgi:hypothetical protein
VLLALPVGLPSAAWATAGEPAAESGWAFRSLKTAALPVTRTPGWVRNSIDAFVLQRLEAAHLSPAPEAGRLVLLRRLAFDLLGLPPTPEEIEAFVRDERPDAYERLVERLLASPRYGERWGRHWLDVVRYADTGGFEHDFLYPNAYRYRDYVIRSFNANKPFDRFLCEQVAGDELWPGDPEAVRATALYCVGPAVTESAMIANQLEYEWLTDAVDTTGAAFLGLTFGCARCHDHKYDPLTQKDYFGLQAVFAASDRPYPDRIRLNRIKALNGLLSDAPVPKELLKDPRCTVHTEEETGFHLFHRPEPLPVRRLARGELSKPREEVGPAFPAALRSPDRPADFGGVRPNERRAALARWLTSPDNPLPARVLVNRVWAWHFGQGLVRTPNDFGSQGEPPTHPDLLDWLARDCLTHGWDLKRLHRLILLSSTYRQSSVADRGAVGSDAIDPDNRLLGHFPRRRLEGEALRDHALACAGTLNAKPFGPAVVPPLSAAELAGLFDAKGKWPVTRDAREHTRRSVYLLERRTFVYPMFAAFDPPEVMTSCPRRTQTVVPAQALTLLNSPFVREQAAAFARRLLRECGDRPERVASRAWLLAFGRPITARETAQALRFLHERTAALARHASPGEAALADLCLALFNANEFVYVD